MDNTFHITVGVGPLRQSGLNLNHELRILKAAMLYADKVKYYSISTTSLLSLLHLNKLSDKAFLEFLVHNHRDKDNRFAHNVSRILELKSKKYRSAKEIITLKKLEKDLQIARKTISQDIEKQALENGLGSVSKAVESGIVELQLFEGKNIEEIKENFISTLRHIVLSDDTYPLFDESVSKVVRQAIDAGVVQPGQASINRAKHSGLSHELLSKLPLFDDATIDEILDIRRELDRPLIKFRSAIIKFSKDISSAAWDKDFPMESEQIFREYVEPSVLEIEDGFKSNKLLLRLIPDLADKPIQPAVASSVLGFALSQSHTIPDILAVGLGLTAGVATSVLRTYSEWAQRNQSIQANQLYFYYKAGQTLKKSSS